MPVMVVGAETALGEAVTRRLLRTGGQVRVYIDPDHDDLIDDYRALGCKVARGTVEDTGRLEVALTQVHTVIHAPDSLLDDPAEVLDGLAAVAEAAVDANVRRLVWPSWIGAPDPAGDAWLAMCAEAEQLLAGLPFESVVIRRALTYGPGDALTTAVASAELGVAGPAVHAPLWLGDLADALAAADEQRGEGDDVAQITVELAGPESMPLLQLASLLREAVGSVGGLTLPGHALNYLAADRLPGPDALGATGTRVADALSRLTG